MTDPKELTFSILPMADHMCEWYARVYPQYTYKPSKAPGQRRWRIAVSIKETGAFWGYQTD